VRVWGSRTERLDRMMAAREAGAAPLLRAEDVVISAVRLALERGDRVAAVERYAAYARACTLEGRPRHPELDLLFRRALRELDPDRSEVPAATPFFGRAAELADVLALVRSGVPAVVLHGPGGVGKTRLARAAFEAARTMVDETRWCSLADDRGDPIARLQSACDGVSFEARALFVIDRAERHIDRVAATRRLLRLAAPGWTFLVTTRFAGVEDDASLVPLGPFGLDVPPGERVAPAVAFLVERARAAGVRLGTDDATSRELATIAARVAGLPLALEIVAAQLRSFSPGEALARLDAVGIGDRFAERAVASSLAALSAGDRRAFGRLGVFSGRWSLEDAASALALEPAASADEAGPILERLVAWSLVTTERAGPLTTYGFLGATHGVAEGVLDSSGERAGLEARVDADALARATRLGNAAMRGDASALDRIEASLPAIRAAIERARETAADDAARAFLALESFWLERGHMREALALVAGSIRTRDDALAARIAVTEASCARRLGDSRRATTAIERALAFAERVDEPAFLGRALRTAGAVAFERGDHAGSEAALERAIALEAVGSPSWGRALANLAVLYASDSREDEALAAYDRIEAACDDVHLALTSAVGRATCFAEKNDAAAARAWIDRAHALLGERPSPHDLATVTHGETLAATLLGDSAWALTAARSALSVAMVHDLTIFVTLVTGLVAIAAATSYDPAAVALVYGFAEAARRRDRMPSQPALDAAHARATAALSARLGHAAFASARRVGAASAPPDIVARIFALGEPRDPAERAGTSGPNSGVTLRLASGHVVRDGTIVALAPRERDLVHALVAVERTVSRERLIDALWPDQTREHAANALRVTLHRLRSKLGSAHAIERLGDGFRLDPRVAVDLNGVERALRRRDDADQDELVAFVDDVRRSSGLPPSERPWTGAIERRVERAAQGAALRIAEAALLAGRPARALEYADWLCAAEPFDEEGIAVAVRAWHAIGDPASARRIVDDYATRLRAELGAEPGQALRALVTIA